MTYSGGWHPLSYGITSLHLRSAFKRPPCCSISPAALWELEYVREPMNPTVAWSLPLQLRYNMGHLVQCTWNARWDNSTSVSPPRMVWANILQDRKGNLIGRIYVNSRQDELLLLPRKFTSHHEASWPPQRLVPFWGARPRSSLLSGQILCSSSIQTAMEKERSCFWGSKHSWFLTWW